jgi:transposase
MLSPTEGMNGLDGPVHAGTMPDPEVSERPRRRRFTAAYKLAVLAEVDRATEPGEVGAILRRERLYSSHLVDWRRARDRGALEALARPLGRPRPNPLAGENERLRRENDRLSSRLATAERIIEIQGKVSELLGIPLARGEDDESGS